MVPKWLTFSSSTRTCLSSQPAASTTPSPEAHQLDLTSDFTSLGFQMNLTRDSANVIRIAPQGHSTAELRFIHGSRLDAGAQFLTASFSLIFLYLRLLDPVHITPEHICKTNMLPTPYLPSFYLSFLFSTSYQIYMTDCHCTILQKHFTDC